MSKLRKQRIDAMVKRLRDLAFPTIGDEWGGDCCAIDAACIGTVIRDVRYRFKVGSEQDDPLWGLFNLVSRLNEWETPERIAELLVDHGVKP